VKQIIADYAAWVVVVSGGLAILWRIASRTRSRVGGALSKWNAGFDTLNGRPAITHPDTGEVLVEATPGLGNRLARMEDALVGLSDTRAELGELREQVVIVGNSLSQHIQESAAANSARAEEQTAMWNAIQAVAESRPPVETTVTHTERSV